MATTQNLNTDELRLAVEALEQAREHLRSAGLLDDPHFRAYLACHVEGEDGGWLGGPFLIDGVRSALTAAEAEAEAEALDELDELDELDDDEEPPFDPPQTTFQQRATEQGAMELAEEFVRSGGSTPASRRRMIRLARIAGVSMEQLMADAMARVDAEDAEAASGCRVCGWEDYSPICPSCKADAEAADERLRRYAR